MKLAWIAITILFLVAVFYAGQQSASLAEPASSAHNVPYQNAEQRLADSMQRKLDHLRANAELPHPDQTPTVFTEEEVNAYFASGRIQLPQGVKKVSLQGQNGVVNGQAMVDFDQIRAGQRSSNPLLILFSGTHNVHVDADVAGSGGQGKVHTRAVSFDGIDVSPALLKIFLDKYVTPKYPNVGIDSHFDLPEKIDTATVGYHKLVITQK